MLTKLDSCAMPDCEKKVVSTARKELSDIEMKLFLDETICITLQGLAHIKDAKAKIDTLKSVHRSMVGWATDDKKKKICQNMVQTNKILSHALILIQDIEPSYDAFSAPIVVAETSDDKVKSGKGRGPGVDTLRKISLAKATKAAFEENTSKTPSVPSTEETKSTSSGHPRSSASKTSAQPSKPPSTRATKRQVPQGTPASKKKAMKKK